MNTTTTRHAASHHCSTLDKPRLTLRALAIPTLLSALIIHIVDFTAFVAMLAFAALYVLLWSLHAGDYSTHCDGATCEEKVAVPFGLELAYGVLMTLAAYVFFSLPQHYMDLSRKVRLQLTMLNG